MLQAALGAEVAHDMGKFSDVVDTHGHRALVRNGYMPQRELVTGFGADRVTLWTGRAWVRRAWN